MGGSFLQKLNYDYLPNGFLSGINADGGSLNPPDAGAIGNESNDLFGLKLAYNQIESNLPGVAQFNGNIAQLSWKVMGKDAQSYGFTYDYLNRVETAGSGARPIGGAWSTTTTYDAAYGYDKRGNLQTITRRGLHFDGSAWQEGQIDNLTFDGPLPYGPSGRPPPTGEENATFLPPFGGIEGGRTCPKPSLSTTAG